MGNSSSRDKDLIIYIETQKPFYNAGSNIEGVVFVEAKRNFHFDALLIRIEGDQFCQWFEGSSKNRRKFTGNQNFYTIEHMLQSYDDSTVQAGCYAYPFSLELSENIPGSYSETDYDSKIEYKLAAYFANYSEKNKNQIEYIPLQIREPFRQDLLSYEGNSIKKPSTCGCFSQGQVDLHVSFEQNAAIEGESVKLNITLDNSQGTATLQTILVQLVQYHFVCSNNGVHRTYRKVIEAQDIKHPVEKGQKEAFSYDLRIPVVDHQTAIGTLVANYFRVEVSTKAGWISSENPCIYSPLFIIKTELDVKPNYKPQAMNGHLNSFKTKKTQYFRAPEHWFKKNKNLEVMNFKLEDAIDDMNNKEKA